MRTSTEHQISHIQPRAGTAGQDDRLSVSGGNMSGFACWKQDLDSILIRDYAVSTQDLGLDRSDLLAVFAMSLQDAAKTIASKCNLGRQSPYARLMM